MHGESAPRDASVLPWQQVHCDSVGKWTIELRAKTLEFRALTMVDACTNLFEIKRTWSTGAVENAAAFENNWLARYPKPIKVVTDGGPEFSTEFSDMCEKHGIDHDKSGAYNPRANGLIEVTHKTVSQVLRTVVSAKDPKTKHEAELVIEEALGCVMHALRAATSSALMGNSPGALAFGRDMFLDIPLYADILAIKNKIGRAHV